MKIRTPDDIRSAKRTKIENRNRKILNFLQTELGNGRKISDCVAMAANKFQLSMQTIWSIKKQSITEN